MNPRARRLRRQRRKDRAFYRGLLADAVLGLEEELNRQSPTLLLLGLPVREPILCHPFEAPALEVAMGGDLERAGRMLELARQQRALVPVIALDSPLGRGALDAFSGVNRAHAGTPFEGESLDDGTSSIASVEGRVQSVSEFARAAELDSLSASTPTSGVARARDSL